MKCQEASKSLRTAQHTISKSASDAMLLDAMKHAQLCRTVCFKKNLYPYLLVALAKNSTEVAIRSRNWTLALTAMQDAIIDTPTPSRAVAYADIVIDYSQEYRSVQKESALKHHIKSATSWLEQLEYQALDDKKLHSHVIASKSALLRRKRHYSDIELSRLPARILRIAKVAYTTDKNPKTIHELALAHWHQRFHMNRYDDYAMHQNEALRLLDNPQLAADESAQMTLARILRLTFQLRECCEVYSRLIQQTKSLRPVLRSSYIFGEAVQFLSMYRGSSQSHIETTVDAIRILDAADSAGCLDARGLIVLAFLRDGTDPNMQYGAQTLQQLRGPDFTVKWQDLKDIVIEDPKSVAGKGLLLGIEDAYVWTRLGTFYLDIVGDTGMARMFFETATRIHQNAVTLTNLSRFYLRHGSDEDRSKAMAMALKARDVSPPFFRWWIPIIQELKLSQSLSGQGEEAVGSMNSPEPDAFLEKYRLEVESLDDSSEAGKRYEQIVMEVIKHAVGVRDCKQGRGRSSVLPEHNQSDIYFTFDKIPFVAEVKHQTNKMTGDDIVIFRDRVQQVPGRWGLFITESGLTKGGYKRISNERDPIVLLMTGNEFYRVLNGEYPFEKLLNEKIRRILHDEDVTREVLPTELIVQ